MAVDVVFENEEMDETVSEAWGEECEGLKAIYGDRFRQMDPFSIEIKIEFSETVLAATHAPIWKQNASKVRFL